VALDLTDYDVPVELLDEDCRSPKELVEMLAAEATAER
jgi:hypothetical protein